MVEEIYPRFIQNRPCGEDKMDGRSQRRLVETIETHILRNDKLGGKQEPKHLVIPRIIGLEGEWGSGKSNVIQLLKKSLDKDNYHFFEYDAWGNQHDLPLRSILELLTKDLVKGERKLLTGKTKVLKRNGVVEKVTWEERLNYLFARKTETQVDKYPKLNFGVAGALLVLILTPVASQIGAVYLPAENATLCHKIWSVIIAAFPLLAGLVTWLFAYLWNKFYKHNNEFGLGCLLTIFKGDIMSERAYETISQDEPSAREFRAWMKDISDALKEKGKPRLILVIDNMDRLPAEKVKQLWSSIHTFFAEEGFEYIWVIIPFDFKQLKKAFQNVDEGDDISARKGSNGVDDKTTEYFINKTFPVVYHVAPPIISDYRSIFHTFFVEAFGKNVKYADDISRIYRRKNPNPNVREIISFINGLVALHQNGVERPTLLSKAVFLLFKDELSENPEDKILSDEYLSDVKDIVKDKDEFKADVSALVYGVDIEIAGQIPMKRYLRNCFGENSKEDINRYANNKLFDEILDDVLRDNDQLKVSDKIKTLSKLERNTKIISGLWELLAIQLQESPLNLPVFDDEYQQTLLHVGNPATRKAVADNFYRKIHESKEVKGGQYYSALKGLDAFIDDNNLGIQKPSYERKVLDPAEFLNYVSAAQDDYLTFNVVTDADRLETHLRECIESDNFRESSVIKVLKNDSRYHFTTLPDAIKTLNGKGRILSENVGEMFSTYAMLSDERPLTLKLTPDARNNVWANVRSGEHGSAFFHVAAMMVSLDDVSSDYFVAGEDEKLAEYMPLYTTFEDALMRCKTGKKKLCDVINTMIIKGYMEPIDITRILPLYYGIKKNLECSDLELLQCLARCSGDDIEEKFKGKSVETIIPDPNFYKLIKDNETSLMRPLFSIVVEALGKQNAATMYSKAATNYYWNRAAVVLIENRIITVAPANLVEYAGMVLDGVAGGQITSSLPAVHGDILSLVQPSLIGDRVIEIRNKFCNTSVAMTAYKFRILEPWLREAGDLRSRHDCVSKILLPVVGNDECLRLILDNASFYAELVNEAGNQADSFKSRIQQKLKDNATDDLIAFAQAIGVSHKTDASIETH